MTDADKIHRFAEQNLLVERYLLRELTGADLEDFELHLFECAICFEQVHAGQVFAENISGAPPVAPRSPRKRLAAVITGLLRRFREARATHVLKDREGQR